MANSMLAAREWVDIEVEQSVALIVMARWAPLLSFLVKVLVKLVLCSRLLATGHAGRGCVSDWD